jgi:hypothetical protein
MLNLTLPERGDKELGDAVARPINSAAISTKLSAPAVLLDDWRTGVCVYLPWDAAELPTRSRATRLPQAMVAVISVLVLAGGLRWGASPAFLCWWAAAAMALLWALAIDGAEPAVENKEPAKEAITLALVVVQFVSVAVIWTTFHMVRLR